MVLQLRRKGENMKTLCKVLSLLLLASAGAFAQSAASGNISAQSADCTAGASCVVLNNLTTGSASAGGVTVGLSGSWSGTVAFEATNDGVNWVAINAMSASGTSPVTTASGNDTFQINSAGFTGVRVRCSAFSTGPIAVKLQSSTASARSNGSGGGGGGGTPPGGATDSVQYNNAGVFGGAAGVSVDSGTTTILNATGGVTTGSSPPSNCVAGSLCASQVASHPTPTAGVNSLDSDSAQGCWMQTLGTASPACIVNTVTAPVTLSAAGVLAVPAATSSVLGIVRADNTTITNAAGVLTAVTSGGAFTGGAGTSFQDAKEIAGPGNPASTFDRLYMDSSSHTLKCLTTGGGSCLPTSGTVTTSGSPAATYCSIFSGSTAIVGTADCTFAAGALTLGAAGTSTGVLNMAGTTSGSISATPNATATTLTLGGSLTGLLLPSGTVSAVAIGTTVNTGLYALATGVAHASSGTLDFSGSSGAVKAGGNVIFSAISLTGNNTFTGGIDGSSTSSTGGSGTFKGADITSGATSAGVGGLAVLRGGNNAQTGATETAGNVWVRPGDVSSATPTTANNGTGIFSLSGVKGSTYTTSALQAISATATTAGRPPVYSDATTSGIFDGVALAADGNAANVQVVGDATVLSAASVTFTAGDIVCQDGSNPKDVIDNGTTACTTPQVGHVQFTNTGTTHYITLAFGATGGGGGSGTVTSSGSPVSGNIPKFTTATNIAPAAASDIVGLFSTCSGTQYLGADGSCHTASGSGTVTVVSSGSLTSTALVTGGGTTTLQTPSATATMDSSGNVSTPGSVAATLGFSSAADGTHPGILKFAGNTTLPSLSANTVSIIGFPAATNTAWSLQLPTAIPTTGQFLKTTVTGTNALLSSAAIAAGDLPGATGQILAGSGPALSSTPALGVDNSVAGTLQLASTAGTAHTIWASSATTSNTISGFATVPATGHLIDCTSASTICILHDSGVTTANVVNASSPGAGIAHFAGSTQTVTSSAIVAADITNNTITGTQLASSLALVTPSIGAATGTSLYATGIVDGKATMNVSTTTPCTLGTASSNCSAVNSLSGYTINEHATAGTAITYNLPTAAAGLQYCVANGYNGSAANTGTLELLTSATGQFIIYTDGTLSATHGNVTSTGAAGDAACVVGVDATHWMLYVNRGSWTKN